MKNKFPYGNIEGCKYGVKGCVQYLIHMNHFDKHQYTWDNVVTNNPSKLEDHKIPGRANTNAKLQSLIDKILAGELKECDIEPTRNIQVIVIQGPPRVGKSIFCKVFATIFIC